MCVVCLCLKYIHILHTHTHTYKKRNELDVSWIGRYKPTLGVASNNSFLATRPLASWKIWFSGSVLFRRPLNALWATPNLRRFDSLSFLIITKRGKKKKKDSMENLDNLDSDILLEFYIKLSTPIDCECVFSLIDKERLGSKMIFC